MKSMRKTYWNIVIAGSVFTMLAFIPSLTAAMPAFDINRVSDMSGYDPTTFENPEGDVVKIGLIEAFSGPGAFNGQVYWLINTWLAYDINKRGGIMVDGKKKKIAVIKGDSQAKPAICKKITEKLCLEDKVDVLVGTAGSHLTLIVQQVAGKYKTVFMNPLSLSDALMDANNFNRYVFRTTITTKSVGMGIAYYYSKRPENKFYILNQDYSYGHLIGSAFKDALQKYKPGAEIVGEDYHPLFIKDFAPYITKVQASGAQVIFTGDWSPDSQNLLIQARQMKCMLPFANIYMDSPAQWVAVGVEGSKGLVNLSDHHMTIDTPEMNKFIDIWHNAASQWKAPYDTIMWAWPTGGGAKALVLGYWMWDVVERAGSTDSEKIITTWEGDTYKSLNGVVHMRACDHQVVRDVYVAEFVYPNRFYENAAAPGKPWVVPAEFATPDPPADLERCKK
ncbi:MAG: ABC transporter substrate-binding protein [Syntrophales bacterium]|jgi:ABC-type branched-subunit amino acid transport system substrate-binding protein|nr:ABC transporter substrate-binding protein [Syntrophales bacterium]